MKKVLLLSFVSLQLSGCALLSGDFSVQNLGESILSMVGLGPAASVYDTATSIAKATENMSEEEEYYLGRAVSAKVLATYPLVESAALQSYVNKVGTAVAVYSDLPQTFGGYHFAILDSTELNAMATPGGFVFITRGLFDTLTGEDQLAAVFAHEVVHVSERHGVKAISQARLSDALTSLGKLAGSLNCADIFQQATAVFDVAAEDVFQNLVQKGYDREQEYEADAKAAAILIRAGYDPRALRTALVQLEQAFKSNQTGWFNTHPAPRKRVGEIDQVLTKTTLPTNSTEGKSIRTARFLKLREVL